MNIDSNITLLSALMLFGGLQGLFLSLLLLRIPKDNFFANRYLALFISALSLILIHEFLIDTRFISQVPFLIGVTLPLEFLLPPTLYLYVITMTQSTSTKFKTELHFIPVLIGIILGIPFYILDFDTKLIIIENYFISTKLPGLLQSTFPVFVTATGIQFTVYLFLSFKHLYAHTKTIARFFSYREHITLSWLRNFLLIILVFWLSMFVFYNALYNDDSSLINDKWLYLFSVAAIIYMGIMGLLQPRVYNARIYDDRIGDSKNSSPEVTDSTEREELLNQSDDSVDSNKSKYKNSALNESMSNRIISRLTAAMDSEKPYLKNNLSLSDLADIVSTSPNYLSQVINQQLHMNFFDYINSYRIEMAKKLIIKPLPHTKTILDIAMESAFNSKSAFYAAFKKQAGITPAQFKKLNR